MVIFSEQGEDRKGQGLIDYLVSSFGIFTHDEAFYTMLRVFTVKED